MKVKEVETELGPKVRHVIAEHGFRVPSKSKTTGFILLMNASPDQPGSEFPLVLLDKGTWFRCALRCFSFPSEE